MNKEFVLKSGSKIGGDNPTYIIAEMSANHGGDFHKAIEIIHKAKEVGADCIKIQTYTADTLTIDCDNEYFQIDKGNWKGESLYSLYDRAYTPWEWQKELKLEAEKVGLDFLSTPFDKTAVNFLEEMDIEFYKIASFELIDLPLVKYIAAQGKPIIASTGMATIDEIVETYNVIKESGNEDLVLLRCSSAYPAVSQDMKLNIIPFFQEAFGISSGLSDHSFGHTAVVAAVALGAKVIEKHICLDREFETADSGFSMEPEEFKAMVEAVREIEKALGHVEFNLSDKEKESSVFRRSIFVVNDVKKGEVFTEDNIRCIRPSHGLKPKYYEGVIGKIASKDIQRGSPMAWHMID